MVMQRGITFLDGLMRRKDCKVASLVLASVVGRAKEEGQSKVQLFAVECVTPRMTRVTSPPPSCTPPPPCCLIETSPTMSFRRRGTITYFMGIVFIISRCRSGKTRVKHSFGPAVRFYSAYNKTLFIHFMLAPVFQIVNITKRLGSLTCRRSVFATGI